MLKYEKKNEHPNNQLLCILCRKRICTTSVQHVCHVRSMYSQGVKISLPRKSFVLR